MSVADLRWYGVLHDYIEYGHDEVSVSSKGEVLFVSTTRSFDAERRRPPDASEATR